MINYRINGNLHTAWENGEKIRAERTTVDGMKSSQK